MLPENNLAISMLNDMKKIDDDIRSELEKMKLENRSGDDEKTMKQTRSTKTTTATTKERQVGVRSNEISGAHSILEKDGSLVSEEGFHVFPGQFEVSILLAYIVAGRSHFQFPGRCETPSFLLPTTAPRNSCLASQLIVSAILHPGFLLLVRVSAARDERMSVGCPCQAAV